jgi:ATP/maltotriose-dependent transcriptional regulator MalT
MPVSEHLVGRAGELASLDHLLAGLDGGHSAAVELMGEPGIGKTRLLAELSARADARGHLVLAGSASELERDLPFWVFVDALDEYIRGVPPDRLDSLELDVRTELPTVFPSLSTLDTGHEAALQHERYRSHRAVRELLELLAKTQPLVLMLDDLHWADLASVELLASLLHRPPAAPVLLALGMRPGQTREELSASLERAHRLATVTPLELVPLTPDEAHEFLGDTVEYAEASELYEESGGNPFYLEQLARTFDRVRNATPAVSGISLGDAEVPPTVAAALLEELALLSDTARRVLEGAAVAGDPFDPELAAAAAGESESAVLEALDELLRFEIVRHTDVPRRFRFRHPLVRRAVYESAPGGSRLAAHERTAEALARRGAPASARAHHVERAARQGDEAAVAILREAGEAVAHRAPASAARWFAGALRLLSESAPAEEHVELLLAQGGALAATGRYAEAHAALLESILRVPNESLDLRVKLTAACAGVEHLLGRHEDAHDRLHGALNALDSTSPEAVVLMLELATDGFFRMEYAPMRGWAGRALATSRHLGSPPLTAAAAACAAFAGALDGAIAEAQAHRSEAAALVDAMSDQELAERLDAAVNLGGAELYLDRFEEAGAHLERAIAVGKATGQTAVIPMASSVLGWVRMVLGELAAGGEMLDGAVEGARLSGHDQTLALNLLNRSLTALAAGDLALALATGRESYELTATMDQSLITGGSGVAYAAALLEDGDAEGAVDAILSRCGGEKVPLMPGTFRAKWLELLARCWLALGRQSDAERAAAYAEDHAAAFGLGMATAMARRARAAVLFDAGDAVGAAELALASAEAGDGAGVVVEAALSRTLAGRALAEAGDRDRALAELEKAVAAFESCGSDRYRAEAERELRTLGRPTHRRTRPGKTNAVGGVESLTGRELQVARLVVDRLTNPEIAAELFLSLKTVETHMHNMFRKLGVASRVELARAVELADRKEQAPSR